jgi:hypothetical protein
MGIAIRGRGGEAGGRRSLCLPALRFFFFFFFFFLSAVGVRKGLGWEYEGEASKQSFDSRGGGRVATSSEARAEQGGACTQYKGGGREKVKM